MLHDVDGAGRHPTPIWAVTTRPGRSQRRPRVGSIHQSAGRFPSSSNIRLMTDNAWAYRWSLRAVCAEHGIRQKFIKPHCPWQNGKVERLNRTLQAEWAYQQVFTSNAERTAALAP